MTTQTKSAPALKSHDPLEQRLREVIGEENFLQLRSKYRTWMQEHPEKVEAVLEMLKNRSDHKGPIQNVGAWIYSSIKNAVEGTK